MESSQRGKSGKGWGLCRSSISRADQTLQAAMRDLPPMVLEARLSWARTRQAGTAGDGPYPTTRNKSPRCVRAQHKGSPPQNHSLRNAIATTTDVSISFLQHSSSDRIDPTSFTRPTDCRSSRPGRPSGMPELPPARLALTSVHNCEKLAGTAPDEPPKSDLQLLPSRGSSVCGLQLRPSENHPSPGGLVGKSRPLSSETSKKSRGFCSIMGFKARLSRLIDPVDLHPTPRR